MISISKVSDKWEEDVLKNVYGLDKVNSLWLNNVAEDLERFTYHTVGGGYLSKEEMKSLVWFNKYYKDGESLESLADESMVSMSLTKNRIRVASKLLSKYWWRSPLIPISVNKLNEFVVTTTGCIQLLDAMKQVGISRIEDLFKQDGTIWVDRLDCIPYVEELTSNLCSGWLDKLKTFNI